MSVFAEHFTLTYLCCFFSLRRNASHPRWGVADFREKTLLTLAGRHRRTVFSLFLSVRLDAGHARNSPGPRQAHA